MKKPNRKKTVIILLVAVALVCIPLGIGFYGRVKGLTIALDYRVVEGEKARSNFLRIGFDVPESASDLYVCYLPWVDHHDFLSMTLPVEEGMDYMIRHAKKEGMHLQEGFPANRDREWGPHMNGEEFRTHLWDLTKVKNSVYLDTGPEEIGWVAIFDSDRGRLFIHSWSF